MYCGKCGKNNSSDNRFCESCGAPLVSASAPFASQTNPSQGEAASARQKKQGKIYLWIFLAIVAVCLVIFAVKVVVDNNKKTEIIDIHTILLQDWDTELDPSDTETTGLELDFTVSELSINLYHYSGGQRKYNRYNGVVTYKYEVISPTCIKVWYKDDSPQYYHISFNDDHTIMYFEFDGKTRVLYAQRSR